MAIRHALFDLNGTLFDPAAIAAPLGPGREDAADAILGEAVLLAMAETVSGSYHDFSELLEEAARRRLDLIGEAERLDAVLAAAGQMRPFPDADAAIRTLRTAGIGVGVLTNSSTNAALSLIASAELPGLDPVIGTDQVGAFKPDARVYRHAVAALGCDAGETALISAHGWDCIGAKRAGLRAAWVARKERVPLRIAPRPDLDAPDLAAAAAQLAAGPELRT